MRAVTTENPDAIKQGQNVAFGKRTSLNKRFEYIQNWLNRFKLNAMNAKPTHLDFKANDVKHSLTDISKSNNLLKYLSNIR